MAEHWLLPAVKITTSLYGIFPNDSQRISGYSWCPWLFRESIQRWAKKEANGVEAFAYSTQETCSTGLTWPATTPSHLLPLSLLLPSRSIHVNLHEEPTRLREHSDTLDATSPRILSYRGPRASSSKYTRWLPNNVAYCAENLQGDCENLLFTASWRAMKFLFS